MELRGYQAECIDKILSQFSKKENSVLVQLPTGSGKTFIFSSLIARAIKKYKIRVLILMHRGILVNQTMKALRYAGVEGCDLRTESGFDSNVLVSTIQSAVRRDVGHINLVIIDEVHRLPPKDKDSQYFKLMEKINHDKLKLLGVTATPFRLKQGYLNTGKFAWFKKIDYSHTLDEMIDDGYLVPMRYFAVDTGLSLDGIKKNAAGDYAEKQLAERLMELDQMDSVRKALLKHGAGRKKVAIFAVNIAHANYIAESVGGTAIHSKNEGDFDDRIIVSVGKLSEGWDCPECDCIIMARPTLSPSLYVQMIGRGLRLSEGKEDCKILDLVGNYNRHGDPSAPKVGNEEFKKPFRICLECGYANSPKDDICVECGANIKPKAPPKPKPKERNNQEMTLTEIATGIKHKILGVEAESYLTRTNLDYVRVKYKTTDGTVISYYPKSAISDMDGKNWAHRKLAKIANKFYGTLDKFMDFTGFMETLETEPLKVGAEVKIKNDGSYKKIVGL